MVATASPKPVKPERKARCTPIPLFSRIKARNLYLVQGLPYKAISAETGLPEHTLQQLASREGWTKLRRENKRSLLAKQDARMGEMQSEALDAIASASEQHALRGLERVGTALEAKGEFAARDFQSWTGGVKNLVSIMREIRAPQDATPDRAHLNLFVLRVGDAVQPASRAAGERNVTPDTEVKSLPVG